MVRSTTFLITSPFSLVFTRDEGPSTSATPLPIYLVRSCPTEDLRMRSEDETPGDGRPRSLTGLFPVVTATRGSGP